MAKVGEQVHFETFWLQRDKINCRQHNSKCSNEIRLLKLIKYLIHMGNDAP